MTEGWAEFFQAARFDDASKESLETNDYWMGADQNGEAGPNTDGSIGNIVEGAVASILWDLWDSGVSDDDGIGGFWPRIWEVFSQDLPGCMWSAAGSDDFYYSWRRRYGSSRPFEEIFVDHGIPVFDDVFEENDSFTSAYALGNTQTTYAGLVLADGADWFALTLEAPSADGSSISLRFDDSRGDLDLYVYDQSLALLASSTGSGNIETVDLNVRPDGADFPPPVVTIAASGFTAAENEPAPETLTVTRTGGTDSALTVIYSVSGSAAPANDYVVRSGSVMVVAGAVDAAYTREPVYVTIISPPMLTIEATAPTAMEATATAATARDLNSPTEASHEAPSTSSPAVGIAPEEVTSAWPPTTLGAATRAIAALAADKVEVSAEARSVALEIDERGAATCLVDPAPASVEPLQFGNRSRERWREAEARRDARPSNDHIVDWSQPWTRCPKGSHHRRGTNVSLTASLLGLAAQDPNREIQVVLV
jgi:hypothetical protein